MTDKDELMRQYVQALQAYELYMKKATGAKQQAEKLKAELGKWTATEEKKEIKPLSDWDWARCDLCETVEWADYVIDGVRLCETHKRERDQR